MSSGLDTVVERLAQAKPTSPDDYCENGYLMCGSCHTRKQFAVVLDGATRLVPVLCDCQQQALSQQQALREREAFHVRMAALQRDGISDPAYLTRTFATDDQHSPKASALCHRYVEHFEQMQRDNVGILFYGAVGTGKSFLACAIANALIERLIPAAVTSLPRLLNLMLQGGPHDRMPVADRLQRYRLLVLDDLGAERDSAYAMEQVYNIIDARVRGGLPLLVTTNLTLHELKEPESMGYKRIYDRVLELCPIRLKMVGDSRRVQNAADRLERARQTLGV